jgi:hypothetical protein
MNNRDEILRALYLLHEPGEVVELRILGGVQGPEAGFFCDLEQLAETVVQYQYPDGGCVNFYTTLNPVDPALLARSPNRIGKPKMTCDADILHRRWLPVDLDPIRPSGTSSTDTQHELASDRAYRCRDFLVGLGWPKPMLASSGNGSHVLSRIDAPAQDDGLVRRILLALDARFSDDVVKLDTSTFNASRIWRLYGTVNYKRGERRE